MPEQDFATTELLRKRDYLLDQRREYIKLDAEHWKSHDQAILTMSSAIPGVSVAFVNQVPRPIGAPIALYVAWIALVLAVVATLVSFRVASRNTHWHISHVDRELRMLSNPEGGRELENRYQGWLSAINNVSGVLFAVGLFLLVIFTINNLRPTEVNMRGSQPASIPDVNGRGTPTVAPASFPTVNPTPQPQPAAPTSPQPAASPSPAPNK